MKITSIDPIILRIPFSDGGAGVGMTPNRWSIFDMVLVRVTTDTGLVGWGEAFSYFCPQAVASAVRELIAPSLIGRDLTNPAALNVEIQRKVALFGRYGITIFALSGVDIALWDLAAKAKGVSLAALINGKRLRENVQAYASLVRYSDPELVSRYSAKATSEGYSSVKLHEVTMPAIRAGRLAIRPDMTLTVDVNCAWSEEFAASVIPELKELDTLWLEEPVFPPEDWDAMRRLGQTGLAIAAGENACTSIEFSRLIPAVAYAQPSITKVGGVTEFLSVATATAQAGKGLMAHSPYFGPGYFATLQMAAAIDNFGMFEYLYVDPDAWIGRDMPLPVNGAVPIPNGAGIGFEPDADVLRRFAV